MYCILHSNFKLHNLASFQLTFFTSSIQKTHFLLSPLQSRISMAKAATILEDLPSDILTDALRRMDGPTLASASCSTSLLRLLTSDPALWRRLCLSTWPSLRHPRLLSLLSGAHRRFFSDSFPFPYTLNDQQNKSDLLGLISNANDHDNLPTNLLSAVDLYHKGVPVFSRAIDTDASSSWFLTSPFRVDGLDRKDPDAPSHQASTEPKISPQDLTLSWIVIDPISGRAVNLSSRSPVSIDKQWYTGETLVRFVVVIEGRAVNIVVTCGEELGHVREVSLTVEDMDGRAMNGEESLAILKGAMDGGRRGAKWEEEIKERYEEYLKTKRVRREEKVRREGMLDLCCTAFGALMFLSFLMLLAFR